MGIAKGLVGPRSRQRGILRRFPSIDNVATYATSIIFLIVLWQFVAMLFFSPTFFPTPLTVAKKGVQMLSDGTLFSNITVSLKRILTGFLIGSILGAPVGLLVGTFRRVRAFLDPHINFFRYIPSIAWLTPAVIWFGIGEASKVFVIFYTTIFTVTINTAIGVSNIPLNKVRAGSSLGARQSQIFLYIILPASLPFILSGMRLAMGNSFTAVVSAEMIGASKGLGFLIWDSRIWMATDIIFLTIVVLGVLGFATDQLFRTMIRKFARRYGPVE
jgi:ABC-type nitrate/sulfonate/bicarbonate transport system permease component